MKNEHNVGDLVWVCRDNPRQLPVSDIHMSPDGIDYTVEHYHYTPRQVHKNLLSLMKYLESSAAPHQHNV